MRVWRRWRLRSSIRLLARARRSGRLGRAARGKSQIEDSYECLGDLPGRHRLILAIPVSNPVERTREGERRHLEVVGVDGPVACALFEQPADPLIDLGLQ